MKKILILFVAFALVGVQVLNQKQTSCFAAFDKGKEVETLYNEKYLKEKFAVEKSLNLKIKRIRTA